MSKLSDFFRKVWLGLKVAAPFIEGAASLLPGGSPVVLAIHALSSLISRAEVLFPAQGSGTEKAQFFTLQGMKVLEILTGKNFDSPEGRILVSRFASAEVAVRNATIELQACIKDVQHYVEHVKDAAIPDTPNAPID
jgi:hypothetical protein